MIEGDELPFVKVLVSRHVVEVWTYEKMPPPSDSRRSGGRTVDPLVERKRNQLRSKWEFMRRVTSTFTEGSMFATFTFRDGALNDVTDVREANAHFHKFMHRMQRRFGHFQWAVVVEFQDSNGRGAVHYHMIANLPYIPKEQLEDIWNGGYVWVNRIDHVDNVGAYVVKYMAADMDDVRLCGLKAWRMSQNCKKPLELRGDDARDFLLGYDVESRGTVYTKSYDSEYHGSIGYRQYNLVREGSTTGK